MEGTDKVKLNGDEALIEEWKLAQNGCEMQMTDDPVDPDRPSNLWEPVQGDHGAHGIVDDQSYSYSPQAWANTHPGITALAGVRLIAGIAGVAALVRKNSRSSGLEMQ